MINPIMNSILLLILCSTMTFWESVLASAVAAIVVLMLTFLIIHPWMHVFPKAVITKEGYLRFQIYNKSFFNIYNVQIKAYIVKEKASGEPELDDYKLNVKSIPQIKCRFSHEDKNTFLVDSDQKFKLEDFKAENIRLVVTAMHSLSNIVQVKQVDYTPNDVYYGDLEHRKLVNFDGEQIFLWDAVRTKLIKWLIWPLVVIAIIIAGILMSNSYCHYWDDVFISYVWQVGIVVYLSIITVVSIVNITLASKCKEYFIRMENQFKKN